MNSTESEKFRMMLEGTIPADREWLSLMAKKYPFFPVIQALEIKLKAGEGSGMPTPDELADIRMMLADPDAAERLANPSAQPSDFTDFYPSAPTTATPTTVNAIDKFLATYGDIDAAETSTLERLIFNPVADYSQQLARQEEESLPDDAPTGDSQTDLINRFILSVRNPDTPDTPPADTPSTPSPHTSEHVTNTPSTPPSPPAPEPHRPKASTPPENSLLSESLAKIYIKTHRYERAYEILSRLSLAFPEKNAYFADQLRFLRKLILAEQFRQKRIDTKNPPLNSQS